MKIVLRKAIIRGCVGVTLVMLLVQIHNMNTITIPESVFPQPLSTRQWVGLEPRPVSATELMTGYSPYRTLPQQTGDIIAAHPQITCAFVLGGYYIMRNKLCKSVRSKYETVQLDYKPVYDLFFDTKTRASFNKLGYQVQALAFHQALNAAIKKINGQPEHDVHTAVNIQNFIDKLKQDLASLKAIIMNLVLFSSLSKNIGDYEKQWNETIIPYIEENRQSIIDSTSMEIGIKKIEAPEKESFRYETFFEWLQRNQLIPVTPEERTAARQEYERQKGRLPRYQELPEQRQELIGTEYRNPLLLRNSPSTSYNVIPATRHSSATEETREDVRTTPRETPQESYPDWLQRQIRERLFNYFVPSPRQPQTRPTS
jgi:hypothetical protein